MNNISSDDELSYWDALKKDENNCLSLLYPDIPEYYFDDKTDIFVKEDEDEKSITPYVKIKNLNKLSEQEYFDLTKSKNAIEIGVKFSF